MPEDTARRRADRPRSWGNRRPATKRLDFSPEEAEQREQERRAKLRKAFVGAFVTLAEKETVTRRANAYGMKQSDFIRTVLLSGLKEPPPPRIDPEVARALAFQLSKVGTNLNQMTARTNEAAKIATGRSLQTIVELSARFSAIADEIAHAVSHVIEL